MYSKQRLHAIGSTLDVEECRDVISGFSARRGAWQSYPFGRGHSGRSLTQRHTTSRAETFPDRETRRHCPFAAGGSSFVCVAALHA